MWKHLRTELLVAVLGMVCASASGLEAATIMVMNADDDGPGSLRAAVAMAASGDQIHFEEALAGATIRFASGEVVINKNLEIIGRGPDQTIITGAGTFAGVDETPHRIFTIAPGVSVTLAGLTLSGGLVGRGDPGGAIFSQGSLTLSDCVVERSFGNRGAGIYNSGGDIRLVRTILRDNEQDNREGALFNDSLGRAYIQQSTIEDNRNSRSIGAGVFNAGTMEVVNSLIRNNLVGGTNSGGAGVGNSGFLRITGSVITGNYSTGRSGGIENTGRLEISGSVISDNFGHFFGPGGLGNFGQASLVNTTLYGNGSHFGAGALSNSGPLVLVDSTLTANYVDYFFEGSAGGISSVDQGSFPGSVAVVKNNLIAGNYHLFDCPAGESICLKDCRGAFSSQGHNIVGSVGETCQGFIAGYQGDSLGTAMEQIVESSPVETPWPGVSFQRALLADNGGPTPTVALLPDSPALDAIPLAACTDAEGSPVAVDQRGVLRPQGDACDIGAFEFSAPRGPGFWAHQCSAKGFHQVGPDELQALFGETADTSGVFPECAAIGCDSLLPQDPGKELRARAQQALLGVWLNIVSGRLTRGRPISLPGLTDATSFTGALNELETTLCDPLSTRAALANAKDLAEALMGGTDDMELQAQVSEVRLLPGAASTIELALVNMSDGNRTYALTASAPWPVQLSASQVNALDNGGVALVRATIVAPWNSEGQTTQLRITATDLISQGRLSRDVTVSVRVMPTPSSRDARSLRRIN